ncbi:hypothetical protein JST97_15385 [bacterium]|nr:hypothetical protein [bacterium]
MPDLPGRMDVERKLACPHCRKLLPDFHPQEILEADQFPLRCPECRQIVPMAPDYVEQVRRKYQAQ